MSGFGPEWFIVIGVIVLLFGGSQLPKLARSLGQAKAEFEKGSDEPAKPKAGSDTDEPAKPKAGSDTDEA